VESGKGSLFPIVGAGSYFYVTLVDVSGNYEIVKATARTGDILTVVRAQQGTLAIPFPANSRIELRVTADLINDGGGGVDSWPSAYANPVNWNGEVLPDNSGRAIDQLADRVYGNETQHPESIIVVCSDETTALTTGVAKVTFRMPFAMELLGVRAGLSTAQTSGSILTVDINNGGTTLLSPKITIDNTERTTATAATLPVINPGFPVLALDDEITIDIDQVGDGTAKGLKVTLSGIRG
jgi:hypothetical protein